jgi:hypothetical protein
MAKRSKERYYRTPESLEVERARSRQNMRALRMRQRVTAVSAF